jgi:hypothetical protein
MSAPVDVVAASNGELAYEDELEHDAPKSALITRLRKQAVAQRRERHIELEIGGAFDPPLVARYGVLPVHELDRYGEQVNDARSSNMEVGIDIMVRTNLAVLARDGDELVELEDDMGSVTFGHRLALLLELPLPPGELDMPPRDVIVALFGGNGIALSAHGGQLLEWMRNPTDESSPGEASGETA